MLSLNKARKITYNGEAVFLHLHVSSTKIPYGFSLNLPEAVYIKHCLGSVI
jgi:hypothetical protein